MHIAQFYCKDRRSRRRGKVEILECWECYDGLYDWEFLQIIFYGRINAEIKTLQILNGTTLL